MSDDELAQLSLADLIGVVRQLEAQLAAAQARIAELEAELARRGGAPKTPENSSTPPSKGRKRERPAAATEGAKRGRPVGHPGTSRRRVEPDWVVLCQPTHCAACGHDLVDSPQVRVGHSQVVELPPVQPVVFEAWRYAATCPHCGTTTAAEYPAGFECSARGWKRCGPISMSSTTSAMRGWRRSAGTCGSCG
jgi:transposase